MRLVKQQRKPSLGFLQYVAHLPGVARALGIPEPAVVQAPQPAAPSPTPSAEASAAPARGTPPSPAASSEGAPPRE